jgi:hypothetical protein
MSNQSKRRSSKAQDGDIDAYAPTTREYYSWAAGKWTRHAQALGISPTLPSVEDLVRFFASITTDKGPRSARKISQGVAYYLRAAGVPVLVDHPAVQAAIEGRVAAPDEDPLAAIIHQSPLLPHRRAKRFADDAYHLRTHEVYRSAAIRWVAWCRSRGLDPLRVRLDVFVEYVVEELASRYAAQTVLNRLYGLSHYFRKGGAPDLTRHEKVALVVEGLRRERPPQPSSPLYITDLRGMLATLNPRAPCDVRSGLLLICMGLGGLAARHVLALDVARRRELPDGIVFFTDLPRMQEIFIGEHENKLLSVKSWFSKWIGIIGDEPGPLFPNVTKRGGAFSREPIIAQNVNNIVKSVAKRAGVAPGQVNATSLRRGFVIKLAESAGAVAASAAVGYVNSRSSRKIMSGSSRSSESARETRLRNLRRRRKWAAGPRAGSKLVS